MDVHHHHAGAVDHQELRMNPVKVVSLMQALLTAPATRIELAKQADMNPKYVGSILRELKARDMVYVIDYTRNSDGRNRVKIWSLGQGKDAEPKQTQSQEERSRKSYIKKKTIRSNFTPLTTFVGGKSLWQ